MIEYTNLVPPQSGSSQPWASRSLRWTFTVLWVEAEGLPVAAYRPCRPPRRLFLATTEVGLTVTATTSTEPSSKGKNQPAPKESRWADTDGRGYAVASP
jgi:hypothetical protein